MKSFRFPALVALIVFAASLNAQSDVVQAIIAQQRAEARPRMLLVPAFSLASEDRSELFLVSKIVDPLPIDIFATNAAGERVYLGNHVLPPSRGLTFDLRQLLGEAAGRFPTGWLRLDYAGDTQTLQAWSVIRSGQQTYEVPFIAPEKLARNEYYSFWDVALPGPGRGTRAEFTVMNEGTVPVTVTATFSRGTHAARVESFELAPQGSRTFDATAGEGLQRGWLRLTHDGPAGSIVAAGAYRNTHLLAYIPVVPATDTQRGPKFEILRMPADRAGRTGTYTAITLFNAADEPQSATVDAVRAANGVRVSSTSVRLAPREVTTLDLRALTAGGASMVELPDGPRRQQGIRVADGLRLRITGTHPGLMVDGIAKARSGEMLDMSVHAFTSAHKSGTYPIPDLSTHDVRTTIVNLSDEPSKIVAQYFWDGGTYAVPMFEVPPLGTVTLEPKKLAAAGTLDEAGRALDARGANLALKWLVRSGSHELLGRTESIVAGQSDGFGFNCGGCCYVDPYAAFNPFDEMEVGLGESPSWEPWVYFQTCSGTVGPYPPMGIAAYDVPWPFSWNFSTLTTSDGGDENIWWESDEEGVQLVGCTIVTRRIGRWGRGKACDKVHNPSGYNPAVQCASQTTSCGACYTCCANLYSLAICKGANQQLAQSEKNACDGNCLTDRC